jgi:solute carrier family 25 (peroxisomal adenine nucleotide transporter), member 17
METVTASKRPLKSTIPISSSVPPLGHAIGGSIGSALALLLLYPLERARTELQANAARLRTTSTSTYTHTSNLEKNNEGTRTAENNDTENPLLKPTDKEEIESESNSSSESWETCSPAGGIINISPSDDLDTDVQPDAAGPLPTRATSATRTGQDILSCLIQLHRQKELYRGVGPVVATLATSNFVFFYAHEAVKTHMFRKGRRSVWRSLLAASIAGAINVVITNPLWVANIRIVQGNTSNQSLWKEMRRILQAEGLSSLWNGSFASLLLVSNPVIQFFVYEQLKGLLQSKQRMTISPMLAFAFGAIAKAVATVLTYPLQLTQVLLRLQQHSDGASSPKYGGTMDCLVKLHNENGFPSLFSGMKAKLLQTVLTSAFTFLTYEEILRAVKVAFFQSIAQQINADQHGNNANV